MIAATILTIAGFLNIDWPLADTIVETACPNIELCYE